MRSTMIRRASVGLTALALFGLTGCADPSVEGALTSFVAALRDANTATKTTRVEPAHAAVAPATELASLPAPAPTPVAASVSAPAAKAAAAVRPVEPASPPPPAAELGALQRQLNDLETRVAALTADNQRQMERLSLLTNGAIADMEQLFNSLRLELRSAPGSDPAPALRRPERRRPAPAAGHDLQAPMRTAVHASATGIVVVAGIRPAYGRVVEIDHGFGIRTRYAHLSTLSVREGDRVQRHSTIGALGSSGRSASPHLHYEVLFNGRPHDPAALLVLAEGIRSLR
ncbi:MAG: M23 family metallopeptidase [Proteobacteria bacterium]|nr:M23 family metallopeptidase [Pseudomonadota bacterium]